MTIKPSRLRDIKILAAVLIFVSAYQYATDGAITWPKAVYNEVTSYLGRPEASWREATDAINDAVPANTAPQDYDLWGRVVRVADGDTLSLLDKNNKQHKIRLFGIDTPERDQPFGRAASRFLASHVAGKTVGIDEIDLDNYGRSVGIVYLDNVNINLLMVKTGHAWWYRHYAGRYDDLRLAEATAKEQGLGLWTDSNPVPPWDWRRGRR